MKLISLNCSFFDDNNKQVIEFLQDQNVDLVCLQEIGNAQQESVTEKYNLKPAIDKSLEYSSTFYSPVWITNHFQKQEQFRKEFGGFLEFGYYFLSKEEISHAKNVFVENQFSYVTDWSSWPDKDYKSVQVVDLNIGDSKVRVLNYHGIWSRGKEGNGKTLWACETINHLAQEVDYPVIICGDFNLFPDSESMQVLNSNYRSLADEYEIKSTRPDSNELKDEERNVVDYIFVSEGIKVNDFKVLDNDVSDHLPLILDFEIE